MQTYRSTLRAAACGAALLALSGTLHSADPSALTRSFQDPALEWGACPEFMPKGCGIAVVRGDPAGSEADAFFRVPAKAQIPLHWHTAAERIVLVSGQLAVQSDGQPPATLTPGTYGYMPARLPHSATCEGEQPCVLFIAFMGPVDANAGRPPAR